MGFESRMWTRDRDDGRCKSAFFLCVSEEHLSRLATAR